MTWCAALYNGVVREQGISGDAGQDEYSWALVDHVDVSRDEQGMHVVTVGFSALGAGRPGVRWRMRLEPFLSAQIVLEEEDDEPVVRAADEHAVRLARRPVGELRLRGRVFPFEGSSCYMESQMLPG